MNSLDSWVHLNPNILLQNDTIEWDKNVSHTIWLASCLEEVPRSLVTNSNLIFLADVENTNKYFINILNAKSSKMPDNIIAFSSGIEQDIKAMIVPKEKFIQMRYS